MDGFHSGSQHSIGSGSNIRCHHGDGGTMVSGPSGIFLEGLKNEHEQSVRTKNYEKHNTEGYL
jgi:hypothetical protein